MVRGGIIGAGSTPQPAKPTPLLQSLAERAQELAFEAHVQAGRVERGLDRVRSEPQQSGSDKTTCSAPDDIVGKMSAANDTLAGLVDRLAQLANRIDALV